MIGQPVRVQSLERPCDQTVKLLRRCAAEVLYAASCVKACLNT